MEPKSIIRVLLVTALILLVPLIAMQFTSEVNWTLSDFVIMGTLLAGAGLAYEFVSKKGSTIAYRAATMMAVGTALLLTWANLAVGLIGNEDNPANALYLGVIIVLFLGSIVARLKPKGMMYVLFATAAAQMLVPVIAMSIWKPEFNYGVVAVLGVNVFFAALWVGSALLYRNATLAHAN